MICLNCRLECLTFQLLIKSVLLFFYIKKKNALSPCKLACDREAVPRSKCVISSIYCRHFVFLWISLLMLWLLITKFLKRGNRCVRVHASKISTDQFIFPDYNVFITLKLELKVFLEILTVTNQWNYENTFIYL